MAGDEEIIYIDTESETDDSEDCYSDITESSSSDAYITVQLEDSSDSIVEIPLYESGDEYDEESEIDADQQKDDSEDLEENLASVKSKNSSPLDFPLTNEEQQYVANDFTHLEDLLEKTNRQITNTYEEVLRIESCEHCIESFIQIEQAVLGQDNPEGTVPQPVAEASIEDLFPGPDTVPCDGGVQRINSIITSVEQPALEALLTCQQTADFIPDNDPNNMVYQVIVGIEDTNSDTDDIPLHLEMPEIADASVENYTVTINNPTSEENHHEQDIVTPPIFHSIDTPVMPQAILENNPEAVNCSPEMRNSSGLQNLSSSTGPAFDSDIEEVVLVEMPKVTEVIVDGNKQTVYPALLGIAVPPDPETVAASVTSEMVIEKLMLIEVTLHPEDIVDDNTETLNSPIIPENSGCQEPAAAPSVSSDTELNNALPNEMLQTEVTPEAPQIVNRLVSVWHVNDHSNDVVHVIDEGAYNSECTYSVKGSTANTNQHVYIFTWGLIMKYIQANQQIVEMCKFKTSKDEHCCQMDRQHQRDPFNEKRYLGDPGRNVRLPNIHLVTARNKPTPTYAACYLANLMFSEEILHISSVADCASHCMPTDHNRVCAIREYLLAVFPNYDLREEGKDWEDCLSAISFMFKSSFTETEVPTDRNFIMPVPRDWCTRSSDDVGEGPSKWLQEVRETVIREIGNSEKNASANAEGTDNEAMIADELVYLGDPSRNIQIPYSVLKIAKACLHPDLSAKYIVLHLFPEKVLIGSNVYGNMECGLFTLDPTRIDALREFLQGIYPEYDLEETGYNWKLCVTAINSCLQAFRQGIKSVTI